MLGGTSAAQPAQPLQVDLDHGVFAYDGDASLLEMYLAFGIGSMQFERDSAGYRTQLPLRAEVYRSSAGDLPETPQAPVWADSTLLRFAVADTAGIASGSSFLHQVRTVLPPGAYEMRLSIPAEGPRPAIELRRDVLVPDYEDGTVRLSDITLASGIVQSNDRSDPFYKNGLSVRPNANQLFGAGLSTLYYYAEAYNVPSVADTDDEYTALTYVAEANRPQPIAGLEVRQARAVRTPDVLVGSFDVAGLPSGAYFLRIAILNARNEAVVEGARKFFVYNPAVQREAPEVAAPSFESSAYASMPADEVEQALAHLRIIATDAEQRRARRIEDLEEQRRFLMDFWQKRDPVPQTPQNEFREQFYQRLQYANERYSNSYTEGWQSDRGRTLIKYGPPAAIEPHLYERDMEPYEIWQYNNIPGEGQAQFVFADRDGFGQFELLHSTVTGERKMPNWQMELRQ